MLDYIHNMLPKYFGDYPQVGALETMYFSAFSTNAQKQNIKF
jgi:hypothetical protein